MTPIEFIAACLGAEGLKVSDRDTTTLTAEGPDGETWHVIAVATKPPRPFAPRDTVPVEVVEERREIPRDPCGFGGCSLPPNHSGFHLGPCACASGCAAEGCPNA